MKVSYINEIADLCENVGCQCAGGGDGDRSQTAALATSFSIPDPDMAARVFPKTWPPLSAPRARQRCRPRLIEQVEKVNTERKIAMADPY